MREVAVMRLAALLLVGPWLAACGSGAAPDRGASAGDPGSASSSAGTGAGGAIDVAPTFTAEERAALVALSPEILPTAPPDASNAYADDAAAAALGKALFFSTQLSGALLDGDNNG